MDELGRVDEEISHATEALFVYTSLYRTGHPLIDSQHQELFRILGRMLTSSVQDVTVHLQSLADYTQYHFSTEEALMREASLPDRHTGPHQEAHRQFQEFVRQAQTTAAAHADLVQGTVVSFLAQWIGNHIHYTDMALIREISGLPSPPSRHPVLLDTPPMAPEMLRLLSNLWDTTGTQLFHLVAQLDRLARLQSLYQALAGSVDALLNATTEGVLWQEFCENLTHETPFNAVWIGHPKSDGVFQVLGRGGPQIAQIDEERPVLSENPQASVVVQAWRRRSAVWTNDTLADWQLEPWHESFARNQWHSLLAIPVNRNGNPWSVLAFASNFSQIFDTDTVDLCRRLSLLASHGIDAWDLHQSLHHQQREQAKLARTDALTQLPNRLGLDEYLKTALAGGAPFALALLDLDDFKLINDQWGHDVGDQVLQAVARRLRRAVRREDFVSRFGGDEFVLIVPLDKRRSTRPHQIDGLVQRLIRVMSEPLRQTVGTGSYSPRMTMGVAWYPYHGRTASELLRLADKAMYYAKRNKTDRTQWWRIASSIDD